MQTTEIKNESRIQHISQQFEQNQRYILTACGYDVLMYRELMLETGQEFLQLIYPQDQQQFAKYYQMHAYSKAFWAWFEHEWKLWQNELIHYIRDNRLEINERYYKEQMQLMIHDGFVESSFNQNYLKSLTNVNV